MPLPAIWNFSLWDTFNPHLYTFGKYNQDFTKQCTDFLERRAKLEEKYAKDVRKLCKEFKSKDYDKKEKIKFTLQCAFDEMLKELESKANQHDTLHEELLAGSKKLRDSLKEVQKQALQSEKNIQGLIKNLDKSQAVVQSGRQLYHKSFADLNKAKSDYNANKDNKEITKSEEERYRMVYDQKQQSFESRKQTFAKEVSDFNAAQRRYFTELLPQQLCSLQEQEETLVEACRLQFRDWGESDIKSLNMQVKCARDMLVKVDAVSAEADIREFLRVTASGLPVPADMPFEDLGSNDSLAPQQQPQLGRNADRATIKGQKNQQFGPAQQKRRLEDLLRDKDLELDKARKAALAMQKMLETQKLNPKACDPTFVQQQLQQANDKVNQLCVERSELQRDLDTLIGVSGGDASPSRARPASAAAASPASAPQPAVSVSLQSQREQQHASAFDDEFAQDEAAPPARPLPPVPAAPAAAQLPMVTMLYDFNDPSQPDNLAVQAGERLYVVKADPDWTLVRRIHGNGEGYVPTAYMSNV